MQTAQGINVQNLQTAHAAQYQKINSPIKKMSRIFQYVFLKITHADGQKHMNRCLIALITKKMQI